MDIQVFILHNHAIHYYVILHVFICSCNHFIQCPLRAGLQQLWIVIVYTLPSWVDLSMTSCGGGQIQPWGVWGAAWHMCKQAKVTSSMTSRKSRKGMTSRKSRNLLDGTCAIQPSKAGLGRVGRIGLCQSQVGKWGLDWPWMKEAG